MARHLLVLLLAAASAPATALGGSVGTDLALGVADLGGGERATLVNLNVFGSLDLIRDRLAADVGYSALRDEGSAVRHLLLGALEWMPTDHWSLGLAASGAPTRSSHYALARLGSAAFDSRDRNAGLSLSAGYDTFGERDFEWAAELSAGVTRYTVESTLTGPLGRSRTVTDTVHQLRTALNLVATLFVDTDVSLRATWYGYDRRPDEAGYLVLQRTGFAVGTGMPIAPLRWELRPSLNHRFGDQVSASLTAGLGRYLQAPGLSESGRTLLGAVKASYRPVRTLRLFASAWLQRDVDPPGSAALLSRFGGLGAEYQF